MTDKPPHTSTCVACKKSLDPGLRFCPGCGAMVLNTSEFRNPDLEMIGRVIAKNFLLQAVVGTGAMGTIYRAEQKSLGKTVVIKLIHKDMLGDPTLAMRFHREARAASRLNHPNCIQIIDFGEMEDGRLYIAMEHVSGRDLGRLLFDEYPLRPERVVHIAKQICLALDEAHANGVLHRDLKPENIMVGDRRNMKDFVKVLDFGIAKLMDSAGNPTIQTLSGTVCGTPEFMSPEQARGDEMDARSDLYSVGIMMYQMLTNHLPFVAESSLEVMTKHLTEPTPDPRGLAPSAPASLAALTAQLMAKEPAHRPPSALHLATELDRIAHELMSASHEQRREEVETAEVPAPIDVMGGDMRRPTRVEISASAERGQDAQEQEHVRTQDLSPAGPVPARRSADAPKTAPMRTSPREIPWLLIVVAAAAVVLVTSVLL